MMGETFLHMNHPDNLQKIADAAFLSLPIGVFSLETKPNDHRYWEEDAPHRLAIAKHILDAVGCSPSQNENKSISDTAKSIVAGDRAKDYGDASESFARIAALWSAWKGIEFTSWDVAMMMILLKVSRAKTSKKQDTLIDIIGYAECAEKVGGATCSTPHTTTPASQTVS